MRKPVLIVVPRQAITIQVVGRTIRLHQDPAADQEIGDIWIHPEDARNIIEAIEGCYEAIRRESKS